MADVHIVFEPGWELKALEASSDAVDLVTEEIAVDARRYAPVDTGAMRDSIDAIPAVEGHGSVTVGTDHWRFVEYGTSPHEIHAKPGGALAWPGGAHPVAEVHHPGTHAQPFMRTALYQKRGER